MAFAFRLVFFLPFMLFRSQPGRINSLLLSLPSLHVSLLICTCNRVWQIYIWGFGCREKEGFFAGKASSGMGAGDAQGGIRDGRR